MKYLTFVVLVTAVLFFAFAVPSRAAWHTLVESHFVIHQYLREARRRRFVFRHSHCG